MSTDIEAIFSILYNENEWPMEFKKQNNLRYDFRHSDFSHRNMERIPLNNCQLLEANFYKANLQRVNLQVALLAGANLRETDFRWANLQEADLQGADLRGTDLRWAKNLRCSQVNSVKSLDRDTKFPDYLEIKITGENQWTCKDVNKEMDLDLGDQIDNP